MSASLVVPVVLLLAEPAASPTPTPTKASHTADAPKSRTIVGQVLELFPASREVTVGESLKDPGKGKAAKRESVTLSIPAATQIVRGNRPTTFEDLKVNDHVVVRYLVTPTGSRAVSFRVADPVPRPTSAAPAIGGPTPSPTE